MTLAEGATNADAWIAGALPLCDSTRVDGATAVHARRQRWSAPGKQPGRTSRGDAQTMSGSRPYDSLSTQHVGDLLTVLDVGCGLQRHTGSFQSFGRLPCGGPKGGE